MNKNKLGAKVLLIIPPGKTSFITPPLGLLYLAASLKKAGRRPVILDFLLEKFDQNYLFETIARGVDIIGISTVTTLVQSAVSLAGIIKKKFPEKIIIFGGPHSTLLPVETLASCQSIDFIVKGESEERLNSFIDYLEGKKKEEELEGITFRKEGKIIDLPQTEYVKNLDTLPFPARELVSIEGYSDVLGNVREKPATTLITSRGCPYSCIYCSKPVFGKFFRARSPENVLREIEFLKEKYKVKELLFYDDNFTLGRERIVKICQLLIEKNLNIKWKCKSRVNLVDEELLWLMKKAGCYQIGYGVESGSQKILNILSKGITIKMIQGTIKMTKRAGIEALGYFMLGIPGETEEDIEKTISFSQELNLDFAQFSIATAFPGTELYKIANTQNKVLPDWSESFYSLGGQKNIISLCDIASETLQKYLKKAYRSFYFRPEYIGKKTVQEEIIKNL